VNTTATDPKPLTHRQKRAARLFAYGHNRPTVAARVGVAIRTLAVWKSLPQFQAEVEAVRTSMPEESAVQVLEDLLHDDDAKVRLAAAQSLLKIPADERVLPAQHDARLVIFDHAARRTDADAPVDAAPAAAP
jgi:HEAT repeat protein